MDDILTSIIANKRIEIRNQKEAVPVDAMLSFGIHRMDRPVVSMRKALEKSKSGIIAEFKRKSPSKGWLHPHVQVKEVAPAYQEGGASACSILTDGDYFGGSFADLQQARQWVDIPLLRKDFVIDEYQLFQARILGADAVLLIAAALTKQACLHLAAMAHTLELEVLLEIHNETELDYLTPDIDMLGVNNRNLGTFDTAIDNSFRLIEEMQKQAGKGENAPVFISESGISSVDAVRQLRTAGFRGFLIGETFMKTAAPGETLHTFVSQLTADSR
ncbi:MAG: indole-3-glycerol phosphate synthase TrpC [Tannerella sp.]|jgi:indole-3-glycerol phosphate synthase|nr:indole-3-glycerol phosphate synthase TrpC [Tannerella sp.]